jgi:hypothetical protein
MSFNSHLKKISVVHSDRTNYVCPNPLQFVVYVNMIGPFWWVMNEPSSLILNLFLES